MIDTVRSDTEQQVAGENCKLHQAEAYKSGLTGAHTAIQYVIAKS